MGLHNQKGFELTFNVEDYFLEKLYNVKNLKSIITMVLIFKLVAILQINHNYAIKISYI